VSALMRESVAGGRPRVDVAVVAYFVVGETGGDWFEVALKSEKVVEGG